MRRICTKLTALLSLLLVVVGLTVDVVHPLSCTHGGGEGCGNSNRCAAVDSDGDSQVADGHHHHGSGSASHSHNASHTRLVSGEHSAHRHTARHCDAASSGAERDECPPLGSHHDEDCALCQFLAESVAVLFSEPLIESAESIEFAPIPEIVSPTVRRQSIRRSRAPPVVG